MQLDTLFDKLWQQYIHESPDSGKIYNLLVGAGEEIINDHVAFRTFDDPRINVAVLGQFFKDLGYEEEGEYRFAVKKLFAKHYEHRTDETKPKIFISELISSEFSPFLQATVKACVDKIEPQKLTTPDLLYSGTLWGELDYDIYKKLLSESEYAAWMYVFGFRANHFTVFLNYMKKLTSVEAINEFLKQNGFKLNIAGGEIKGTPVDLLEQSSTIANEVDIKFKQGTFKVPNSYYEFARRYAGDNGKLYQGFVTASADKIFESTDVKR
jgi:hypothetical protein